MTDESIRVFSWEKDGRKQTRRNERKKKGYKHKAVQLHPTSPLPATAASATAKTDPATNLPPQITQPRRSDDRSRRRRARWLRLMRGRGRGMPTTTTTAVGLRRRIRMWYRNLHLTVCASVRSKIVAAEHRSEAIGRNDLGHRRPLSLWSGGATQIGRGTNQQSRKRGIGRRCCISWTLR